METLIDKLKGTIYGQAIGDALGLGTEGMTDEDMAWKYPNGITHYSDIFQDRHRRRWKIGDWTDDTLSLQKNATQSHKLQNDRGRTMIAKDSFVPLL